MGIHFLIHLVHVHIFKYFKVPMKVKDIFCLNLKTFKNDEEWCFLLWNIFSHFRHTQVFVQKLMESQTVHDCNEFKI